MIRAWNTRSGEWQTIPETWIDHPIWGADFTRTKPDPDSASEQDPGAKPTTVKPASRRAPKKKEADNA